jgi:hypothetical protein
MHVPLQYAWPALQVHAPLTQVAPAPHTLPHAPQLELSFVVSTQAPPGHCVGVVGPHVVEQTPPEQTHCVAPGGSGWAVQLCAHAPQLFTSDARLTQRPLQSVWPAGHAHTPCEHCWPCAHVVLHAPQLSVSLVKSTQAPLQFVSVAPPSAAQVSAHIPFKQTGAVLGQTLPQPPQLVGELCVGVHNPLQSVPSFGHRHAPLWQVVPPVHCTLQAPQFALSEPVFTQRLPHAVVPCGHAQTPPTQSCPGAQACAQAPQLFGSP